MDKLKDIKISKLKIIPHENGDILHAMKCSDKSFISFGEAYFSKISYNSIKGWKRHKNATCNLFVPHGAVRFAMHDDVTKSFVSYMLKSEGALYKQLTIPPGIWFAFAGVGFGDSVILNISDMEHDPKESEKCPLNTFRNILGE